MRGAGRQRSTANQSSPLLAEVRETSLGTTDPSVGAERALDGPMRRALLVCLAAAAGCGAQIDPASEDRPLVCAAASSLTVAPRTMMMPVRVTPRAQPYAAPAAPQVLFLNRAQTLMKAGQDDATQNISSVVEQQGLSQA